MRKYYTSPVTDEDMTIFDLKRGSCESQKTLEGLAILVALRLWNDCSNSQYIRLCVRGDNVGALILLLKMRPSSGQQAITARELPLVAARVASPVPSITHRGVRINWLTCYPGCMTLVATRMTWHLIRHSPRHSGQLHLPDLVRGTERSVIPSAPHNGHTVGTWFGWLVRVLGHSRVAVAALQK